MKLLEQNSDHDEKVVLLRHGQSVWNKENRFTGWSDVDLSQRGREEASEAGELLKSHGYSFNCAFTSVLKRAIRTLWIVLDELDLMWDPGRQIVAPERAPLRRFARSEQSGNGKTLWRRTGSSLAQKLRHSPACV